MDVIYERMYAIGYIILFLYSIGGGYVALIVAVLLSLSPDTNIKLIPSVLIAFSANFLGANIMFYMARNYKAEIAKYLSKHRRKVALTHLYLRRYGALIIFAHKYFYGIKTIVPLAMGMSKFSFIKFSAYNFLSSMLWTILVATVTYILGDEIRRIYNAIPPYYFPVSGAIIIAAVTLFIYVRAKKKNKN